MSFSTYPLWILGLLLIVGNSILAMSGTFFVRSRVPLERLKKNNEVAGFKFATVGVLYAVLLAFAVLVVWEKYNEAESNVQVEAGAVATIYRLSDGLDPRTGTPLRDATTAYLNATILDDWAAMERGAESPAAISALAGVYAALLKEEPVDQRGAALLTEGLHQLDVVTQARRARVVVALGIVPGVVWLALFLGAYVTIGFTFFFGAENLRAQALMTGALSVLIFSGLLIIIAFDHPFAGTVRVQPEALIQVLYDFSPPRPQ